MSERWAIRTSFFSKEEPTEEEEEEETLSMATIYRLRFDGGVERGGRGEEMAETADSRKTNIISYTKKFGRTLH